MVGEIDVFWATGSRLRRHLIRRTLDLADITSVQSKKLRDITAAFTSRPVVAVYNGVDTDEMNDPTASAPGGKAGDDHAVTILTVGVLGKRKGYFDLLEAARRLCSQRPEVRFVFVGGGEVDVFRAQVREMGLEECVRVLGQVSDAQRISCLFEADVFALPTYAEGQPIALLEAMAAGLPVISTPVGSIPEVVGPENGRLIQPGDVDALCEIILELASSPTLRRKMGRRNADEAREKYSVKRTMEEIGLVYERLLSADREKQVV